MVIAIDGPAGAGKSTVAKKLADKLGIHYLDTGAMYRAFTLHVLKNYLNFDNLEKIKELLKTFELDISGDTVRIGNVSVNREIRNEEVTSRVSYISSLDFVRKKMVDLQREIGKNRDIVAEGRDIGTVVFPYTKFKFYLDATVEERAQRRIKDEKNQGQTDDVAKMMERIEKRDAYDSSRKISPLKKADDAFYIDSTHMTVDEVCEYIIGKFREQRQE
jgi:cytidylate kinase